MNLNKKKLQEVIAQASEEFDIEQLIDDLSKLKFLRDYLGKLEPSEGKPNWVETWGNKLIINKDYSGNLWCGEDLLDFIRKQILIQDKDELEIEIEIESGKGWYELNKPTEVTISNKKIVRITQGCYSKYELVDTEKLDLAGHLVGYSGLYIASIYYQVKRPTYTQINTMNSNFSKNGLRFLCLLIIKNQEEINEFWQRAKEEKEERDIVIAKGNKTLARKIKLNYVTWNHIKEGLSKRKLGYSKAITKIKATVSLIFDESEQDSIDKIIKTIEEKYNIKLKVVYETLIDE